MRNQKGEVQLTTILLIIAVVVGGYLAVKIAPPYVRKLQIEALVKFIAKMGSERHRQADIPRTLQLRIRDNELPVTPEDFVVELDDNQARVSIDWKAEVTFIPQNPVIPPVVRVYSFHHEAVEPIKR